MTRPSRYSIATDWILAAPSLSVLKDIGGCIANLTLTADERGYLRRWYARQKEALL